MGPMTAAHQPHTALGQSLSLGEYAGAVEARLAAWEDEGFGRRLWAKDPTLWFPDERPEIVNRLGWLTLPESMLDSIDDLTSFAEEVRAAGFRQIVVLGMGGSSLAPEVVQRTLGNAPGYPELFVLDSTHPEAVREVTGEIDPAATLFFVSSKSGTTQETLSFFRYFWNVLLESGSEPAGHFAAITDPGTPLVTLAEERRFRRVFTATPDVGGRYSALTAFCLAPGASIGADVRGLLDSGLLMAAAAAENVPVPSNSALALGAAMGELALEGRDKVTFLVSPSLEALPIWYEQLIAESTGKDGRGIVPIAGERAGPPDVYGSDRFFVHLHLQADAEADRAQADRIAALELAGHPVARIQLDDVTDIGREMYRAELAVAAASAVIGVHPFDQPDVELAKELARLAMSGSIEAGEPTEAPVRASDEPALAAALDDWMAQASAGDFVGIQAYLAPRAEVSDLLDGIRHSVRDRRRVATTVGYGPRFLHSTGQLHKGGPNTGLFLQITDGGAVDLPVPETDYSFGALIRAQAAGDAQALTQQGRRVLRVALDQGVAAGLEAVRQRLAG